MNNYTIPQKRHAPPSGEPLPIEGRSFLTKVLVRIISKIEKLNITYSKVGNPPFFDRNVFPWILEIEKAYPDIQEEFLSVIKRKSELPNFQEVVPGVSNITKDDGWKSLLFTGYGAESKRNKILCPNTWAAIERIPGLETALFSIFEPGKHVPSHRGPYNGVLRLHLGLLIPKESEKVAIRVDTETYHWKPGEAVIFDDTYQHEAWNYSNEIRAVLFIDFARPLRFPANIINWTALRLAFLTPYIREAASAEAKWEKKFYKNA